MRRVIVGDVQGCSAELDALLAKVGLGGRDRLYCVGDLVNRGPDSLGVLRRLRDLDAAVVLGNHDLRLLRIARGRGKPSAGDRFDDVLEAADGPALIRWLGSQPVVRVEADLVVVHGGLHPTWNDLEATAAELNAGVAGHLAGRHDRRIEFATEIRHCDEAGRKPKGDDPPPGPPYEPWDRFYAGRRTVAFGHWARRGLVLRPRLRGLDTGCVYGGLLTAWVVEEDRIVQVPGWRGG
jgi:bis(5'-nucleosyl)-tetraphosphatase (symmetrical)